MKPRVFIGIALIFGALIAVIAFTLAGNASLEVKVDELLHQRQSGVDLSQRVFKLTGTVVGDSIRYDAKTLDLRFDIVQDRETLVNNVAAAPRVTVLYRGAKPDTLVHEAKAIVTGKLDGDGRFVAGSSPDALLLQCPTKYEAAAKAQP
ncbi:MAG: cytochrome c maturation protein CcmE [Thermoflexales bacterium]|nr:cytochrome c maturation protein CcmE [Thermoflexales bacterium]